MEELVVLGTGYAEAVRCFNTCFAIRDNKPKESPIGRETFLVDSGGGNGILKALLDADIDCKDIHHIFVTHEHTDHILGMPWLIRVIGKAMNQEKYVGNLYIYCHADLVDTIKTITQLTVQKKFWKYFDDRIIFVPLNDGDKQTILGRETTFFDIHSTKAKQYGFTCQLASGLKLTCAGDEPYTEMINSYVDGSDWLLHEAFCLYSMRDKFNPYEKHHSTVREACALAEKMKIPNLVLWHTEDKHLADRKKLYEAEGREFYHGNLIVPDDGDIIRLKK